MTRTSAADRILELPVGDQRKTFDDEYGNHALVYPNTIDQDTPPKFGRVDVMRLLGAEQVIARQLHPTRVTGRAGAHTQLRKHEEPAQ